MRLFLAIVLSLGFSICAATQENAPSKRVKLKTTTSAYIPIQGVPQRYKNALQDNKVFSFHKKGNLTINQDFYDMPID